MKRIYLLAFALLLALTGCTQAKYEEALEDQITSLVSSYERPADVSDEDWGQSARQKALLDIARSDTAHSKILELLADTESVNVQAEVARHSNTPSSVLRKFAKDENYILRSYTAANKNLPQGLFGTLSQDSNHIVRQAAAKNPSNSEENMKLLAEDEKSNVQEFLARNISLTEDVMLHMANVSNANALQILLKREDIVIPASVVEKLREHSSTAVKELAEAYVSPEEK